MTANTESKIRMPVAYIPHGGGPWPFVDLGLPRAELDALAAYLRGLANLPKAPPRALLVVSAHWEEKVPTLQVAEKPPLLFDYYNFPPAAYKLSWPAPGAPELAARVESLLHDAGFATATDAARGYDHGTFVPLLLTYPAADVPVLQLSLLRDLDPARHLALGRALAPLRDEGIFIIGSGMSYHDLRGFFSPAGKQVSERFDAWLNSAATAEPAERDQRLTDWANAPEARRAHPREEHLLPLMVIAGAAGADRGQRAFFGTFADKRISAYHFGA